MHDSFTTLGIDVHEPCSHLILTFSCDTGWVHVSHDAAWVALSKDLVLDTYDIAEKVKIGFACCKAPFCYWVRVGLVPAQSLSAGIVLPLCYSMLKLWSAQLFEDAQ